MGIEVNGTATAAGQVPAHSNADQVAVAEYLTSDRYRQHKTWSVEPNSGEVLATLDTPWRASGAASLLGGPLGLAFITLVFAVLLPLGLETMQDFMPRRPVYSVMMVIMQTLVLPPLIAFAFAAVTPMFWYGRVVLRFAMALASTLPACIGFAVTVAWLEGFVHDDDFWIGFSLVMFTSLLATAATAVSMQMWSRWTMTHNRRGKEPLPRTGIGSMIELTAIAAVGCAVFVSIELGDYIEGILFFAALGLISAITITSASIAYFRAGKNRSAALAIGFVFALAAACLLNGFFAVEEYGWRVLSVEALLILAVSLYGAALNIAVMWLCLRWLKLCGWRCVNRKTDLSVTTPANGARL